MYGILRLCSKRFQNEIKIMKYLNILDLLDTSACTNNHCAHDQSELR